MDEERFLRFLEALKGRFYDDMINTEYDLKKSCEQCISITENKEEND